MRKLVALLALLGLAPLIMAPTGGIPITVPQYTLTAAEIANSVTPINWGIAPCTLTRYGTNTTPGTTDMSTAMANALLACTSVYVPAGTFVVQAVVPNTPGLVIYGDGASSLLKQKGTGSVFSWNTSAVVYPAGALQTIRDLAFDGVNGGTHTISTAGSGGVNLKHLFFRQLPTGFAGIFLNGAAATVAHDFRLIDIQIYATAAASAGIEIGPLVNDSSISQLIMNGNAAVLNCIQFDSGAAAIQITDSHPYNCTQHILNMVGNNSFNQFTHVAFDNTLGTGDLVFIGTGGSYNQFSGDYFENVSGAHNGVTLTNSIGNGFVNDVWFGNAGTGYIVSETGTSNSNYVVNSTVNSNGVWTAGVVNFIAANSYLCNMPGVANVNCPGALLSITSGAPTGGNKGTGSVNATAYWLNGLAIPSTVTAKTVAALITQGAGTCVTTGLVATGIASCTFSATGISTVTFSAAYANGPVCVVSPLNGTANATATVGTTNTTTTTVNYFAGAVATNGSVELICEGT